MVQLQIGKRDSYIIELKFTSLYTWRTVFCRKWKITSRLLSTGSKWGIVYDADGLFGRQLLLAQFCFNMLRSELFFEACVKFYNLFVLYLVICLVWMISRKNTSILPLQYNPYRTNGSMGIHFISIICPVRETAKEGNKEKNKKWLDSVWNIILCPKK